MLPSVGIFGTDDSAKTAIGIFRCYGFNVTAIWASSSEKAKVTAAELNIPFYTTRLDELLLHNEVDIVCVCGMPHQYADVAVKSLSIGKHVFCASPAGLSLDDAEKMVSAAQYYPKLLSLMHNPLRFLTNFVLAKDYISKGHCGKILACECRVHTCDARKMQTNYQWSHSSLMGGGVLQQYGSHIIDSLTFLFDECASDVHGNLQTFAKQRQDMCSFRHVTSDDFCCFQMRYASGICACVTINSHSYGDFQQEILITGTKGYLKILNSDLFVGNQKNNGKPVTAFKENRPLKSTGNDASSDIYLQGFELLIDSIRSAFHSTQHEDRRNADHNLIASAANFEDGCYVRAVLDGIILSNQNGEWVNLSQWKHNDNQSVGKQATPPIHTKVSPQSSV